MKDRVTLEPAADDYGRRCRSIGLERRSIADLQDGMNHPNFKAAHHELLDRLAREYRASLPLLERPARWTIKGGGYQSKQELVEAVKAKGYQFSNWAMGVVNNTEFVLMQDGDEYDVFLTTVKELTGKDQVTTAELYQIRDRLGFCDAPCEAALLVRVQYTDQPMDTWECALSKPLADADGYLRVLYVACLSYGSWVYRSFCAGPDSVWNGDAQLLVCRKRQ